MFTRDTLCKSSAIMQTARGRTLRPASFMDVNEWPLSSGIPEARALWCYYDVSVMFCNTRERAECWCCLCWHGFVYISVSNVFISKLSHTTLSPPAPKSQMRLMQMCIYMCVCVCLPSPWCLQRFQGDSLSHLVDQL